MYALEGSGNYVEAERSLDAYLSIIENEKKTLARAHTSSAHRADADGVVQDIDSDEDIIQTMADGVRLLVKYQNKGKKALDVAQKMERNAKAWAIEKPQVLGALWHAMGMANSLWSIQSIFVYGRASNS
jgi:hypothetical protein